MKSSLRGSAGCRALKRVASGAPRLHRSHSFVRGSFERLLLLVVEPDSDDMTDEPVVDVIRLRFSKSR